MGRPASNEQPQGGALEGLLGGTKEIGVSMGEVTVFAVLALGLAYLLIIMIIMMMNISIIIHYCKIYNSGHFNHLQVYSSVVTYIIGQPPSPPSIPRTFHLSELSLCTL
jgi:hypothetical protein